MSFNAKDTGGGDFRRVPPGVWVGRCFSVIDLGHQDVEWEGAVKQQHKLLLKWELFGEDDLGVPLTVDVNGVEMPMTISKRYTLSLSIKARLRGDLAAWRGKDFTPEELKGFDVSKLVGAYCMVNVTQTEANGKTYSNVASLTPLPSALRASKPAPVHANQLFDIDNPDMAIFETFHEKLQQTIEASEEWKNSHLQKPVAANPASRPAQGPLPHPKAAAKEPALADMLDDVPF